MQYMEISIHALFAEGDLHWLKKRFFDRKISIHALFAEGDNDTDREKGAR